jgi:hypothetical protein
MRRRSPIRDSFAPNSKSADHLRMVTVLVHRAVTCAINAPVFSAPSRPAGYQKGQNPGLLVTKRKGLTSTAGASRPPLSFTKISKSRHPPLVTGPAPQILPNWQPQRASVYAQQNLYHLFSNNVAQGAVVASVRSL